MNVLIIIGALILLAGLLFFETRESTVGKLLTKTPLSLLFIVTVLVQPHPNQFYFHFLFLGLLFCLVGDVCLALPSDKPFMVGLVSFLIGHIFYVVAFIYLSLVQPGQWLSVGALIVILFSGAVFLYLRPHLGEMMVPVIAYIVVISLMVCGAVAVLGISNLPRWGRIMVFTGALLFYLSDLFVARDRFIKKEALNRYIGLPLYYGGQFLIAFSVGLISLVE